MCFCIVDLFKNPNTWTAVSAMATAAMAITAFFTLRQNRKQLEEMKRQWNEDRKPIIEVALINPPYCFPEPSIGIELSNIGKTVAEDISIIFDNEFIKCYENKEVENKIRQICSQKYRLAPNERIFFTICGFKPGGSKKTLFGKEISDNKLKKFEEINTTANIHIVCEYKGGVFNRTLSALDKRPFKFSVEEQLSDIAWQVQCSGSDIKQAIEGIDLIQY